MRMVALAFHMGQAWLELVIALMLTGLVLSVLRMNATVQE